MLNLAKHVELVLPAPLTQFVRYRQSFPRKPRLPHFPMKMIEMVTKPVMPAKFDRHFPQHVKCRKTLTCASLEEQEENPYEVILANEIKDAVFKSKMLLIIHRNPATNFHVHQAARVFMRKNMNLLRRSKTTFALALADTKYAPILNLFVSHTLLLACPEPDVYTAYSILKDHPFLIVLAGVVEDKFVDRRTLDEFGKLPDITAARAQLAHTLNTPAMMLAQNINLYGESLEPESK